VNDLKGELAAISLQSLHSRGIDGYCINPYAYHDSAPWFLPQHSLNPLSILTADSPTLTADNRMIWEMLIKIADGNKDDYFEVQARLRCGGLTLFLILSTGKATLPDVYALLNIARINPTAFDILVNSEFEATGNAEIIRTGQEMINQRQEASREYSAIMGTIIKNLSFLDDPAISKTLTGNDFDLDVLTQKKANIYLIIPAEYVRMLSSFIRLIIGVSMICKQRNPSAPRVQFLIDEAGQLGYFEALEKAYTFGRGAGIRLCGVFQSLGQMDLYPSGSQTLLGSSQARIFMGTREMKTALLLSQMIGEETLEYDAPRAQADASKAKMETINAMFTGHDPFRAAYEGLHYGAHENRKEKIKRSLITPDEILALPSEQMILLTSGLDCPPILARKINYFENKKLLGRYMPNPFHPPYDRVGGGLFGGRRIVSEKVPSRLAHYPQFQKGYYSRVV
jgi:type IV secretion system protein VirD4